MNFWYVFDLKKDKENNFGGKILKMLLVFMKIKFKQYLNLKFVSQYIGYINIGYK